MSGNNRPEIPFGLVLALFIILAFHPFLDAVVAGIVQGLPLSQAISLQLPTGTLYLGSTAFLVDGLIHLWMLPIPDGAHARRMFRVWWIVLHIVALLILTALAVYYTLKLLEPQALPLQANGVTAELLTILISLLWWMLTRVLFRHGSVPWLKHFLLIALAATFLFIPILLVTRHQNISHSASAETSGNF